MSTTFLLYGATGYVGEVAARWAVRAGLQPILAGRNGEALERLARELGVPHRVCDLGDALTNLILQFIQDAKFI